MNHTMIRYRPHLNKRMEDFFKGDLSSIAGTDNTNTVPKANVITYEDHILLELAVPGLAKEDIHINLENRKLTVKADKERTEDAGKVKRKGFDYKQFERSFLLPKSVDGQAIEASYELGILSISLPKKEAFLPKPPRNIDIV